MIRENRLTMCAMAWFMVAALVAAPVTRGDDTKTAAKTGVDAKTAFARVKTLAGTWKGQTTDEKHDEHAPEKVDDHKQEATVIYKLTGAGSALVETQAPGSKHEMVSVYHLDGDELRMTHYCAAGNQPRFKLDRAASTPDELIFVFDGGSNLDPEKDMYIHGLKITFHHDGKITSDWEGFAGGKKTSSMLFMMSRQTDVSPEQLKARVKNAAVPQ